MNNVNDEAPKAPLGRKFQRRKQLERDLEHITQEMYKRNRELIETNVTLSLLRMIDTYALKSHQPIGMVCQQITEAIANAAQYPFVALMTRSTHTHKDLELGGWSIKGGHADAHLREDLQFLHLPTSHPWFADDDMDILVPVGEFSDEKIAEFFSVTTDTVANLRKKTAVQSVYAVKLFARGRLVGVILVGFNLPAAEVSSQDKQQLDRLCEGIGLALDSKLLFEENRLVLLQLRRTNEKLKALDETKDDFISMASHQLRTPLTSIKGYLSMVLEGDAGKINETQAKMLGQAFVSSQRMVYLIADLLNVSRLKTGKFIIEAAPTNLAKMVSEEIDQLIETAGGKQIELTYKQPKDFPDVMLDETKTRQVIMNFMDNAIYYTPSGGHIRVELVDAPTSVELRVVDDGIGVPKTEQHHLFTKFYRAGNARKARPDGTGLGLFMAKKVVLAQGGSIIFESREGKGSTFGFLFPKKGGHTVAKLPVVPEKSAAK